MLLITPSLLNAFGYWRNAEFEDSEGFDGTIVTAAEKEANARLEFLQTLRKEKTPPNANMLAGIEFENKVSSTCYGTLRSDERVINEIAALVAGGSWQDRLVGELDGYRLYCRADVIKMDTIYDLKFSKSYEVGKYQTSAQHRMELLITGLPRFAYIIGENKKADDRTWWREDYANHTYIRQEVRGMIADFIGHLAHDDEASEPYYRLWGAKA